jgi:hypothetical protein
MFFSVRSPFFTLGMPFIQPFADLVHRGIPLFHRVFTEIGDFWGIFIALKYRRDYEKFIKHNDPFCNNAPGFGSGQCLRRLFTSSVIRYSGDCHKEQSCTETGIRFDENERAGTEHDKKRMAPELFA